MVSRNKCALLVISRSNYNGRDVSGMTSAVKGIDGRFVAYSSASVVGAEAVGVRSDGTMRGRERCQRGHQR